MRVQYRRIVCEAMLGGAVLLIATACASSPSSDGRNDTPPVSPDNVQAPSTIQMTDKDFVKQICTKTKSSEGELESSEGSGEARNYASAVKSVGDAIAKRCAALRAG